jgi:hypothetical protein
MKKITFLLLTILFFATYNIQAQKQFAGEIRFQTKLMGSDDPNLLSSMESQIITVTILGNKTKAVFKNEMVEFANVWDGDKEIGSFVIEITGMGKYYKKWSTEQWKDKLKFSEFSFNYVDEYKTICDYKCQKVIVTTTNLEDDSTTEQILYVTKEIGTGKINGDMPGLEGFPLMQMTPLDQYCDGCYNVLEAVKITPKKIKDVDFLLPDDAKNIDENPELKEMLKDMIGE